MINIHRGRAQWVGAVNVSAEQFIDAAADWGAIMDYMHPDSPFKFTRTVLAEASVRGLYPCTRLMYIDKTSLPPGITVDSVPEAFIETLLSLDRDTGTLMYRVEGEALGMRNYYGVIEVDAIGGQQCKVTITSRFDLIASSPMDVMVSSLTRVYQNYAYGISAKLEGKQSAHSS